MEKYDIDISEIDFIGNQQRARKIMEEKRSIKVSLSTVFLIVAIIAIIIMGYYI